MHFLKKLSNKIVHSNRKHHQFISPEYSFLKLSITNLYIYLPYRWADIDILESAGTYHHLTTVDQRLSNIPKPDDRYIHRRHENCRINF